MICLNVLEHVEDDGQALSQMFHALEPGGQVVLLVPQGRWLFGSLDEVLGHHRRYSRVELTDKAREAGFEVVQVRDFNRTTVPGWFVNAVLLRRKHFSRRHAEDAGVSDVAGAENGSLPALAGRFADCPVRRPAASIPAQHVPAGSRWEPPLRKTA